MFAVADVSLDFVIGRANHSKKVVNDLICGIRMRVESGALRNIFDVVTSTATMGGPGCPVMTFAHCVDRNV